MRKCTTVLIALMFIAFGTTGAQAVTIDLFDWAFNVDGTLYEGSLISPSALPVSFDDSGFDWGTGLGTLTIGVTGAGAHTVISFLDHEIDEAINTFFNEYGATGGAPDPGQSWEIDEPGWVFGDIYSNVLAGALDNTNAVPMGSEDDVSMAMGWDFTLGAGESAAISLFLGPLDLALNIELMHIDPDSGASIGFVSRLDIRTVSVPEPGTLLLLGSGLIGLAGFGRKRFMKRK